MDYYTDAMENGPALSGTIHAEKMAYLENISRENFSLFPISGHLPIPANFTTVGKPAIYVNQYDNPIDVYSAVSNKNYIDKLLF